MYPRHVYNRISFFVSPFYYVIVWIAHPYQSRSNPTCRDRFSRIQQLSYSIEIISKGFRMFNVVKVNNPRNISASYYLNIMDIYKKIKIINLWWFYVVKVVFGCYGLDACCIFLKIRSSKSSFFIN